LLDRKHSDELLPRIKAILEKADVSIKTIDVFVVGLGPGSFTGLRIGVSTVKGFGLSLGKPCIGLASIDALALRVDMGEKLIVPIIDAKRENVYSAIYRKKGDQVIRLSGYQLIKIDKLMKEICPTLFRFVSLNKTKKGGLRKSLENNNSGAIFLGDGINLYKERIEKLNKKAVFLEEEYWYPKASNLIKLALPNAGRIKNLDLTKLNPIYLYPKDCQVKKG